ncbi:Long-chain fatty acid transport protein 4 [Clonorchis sinensis]|uniref:Very long-chain fatty acid transport protein n=2 Tax=Clonorchis sinensis TaxID=79923 RepID=H2KRX0_CLOSI|nr:Long-chain fatty acid transport protein 4 [Clonorchis sinensis]GAA30321.2 solute carrier family 27 (fatty acid transporter) member 1/4 [Clonorchis sinensis]
MAAKGTWYPCYTFFLLLFVHCVILNQMFWKSFLKSYAVYLLFGGWRFQRVLLFTWRRDLRGLKCYLMILYHTYWNYYMKETFAQLFARTVRRRGRDRVAVYFEDQTWTFGQLDDYSNKVANHLLQCGFKRGDKLFLLMHSSAAYIGIWLGAAKIGVATGLLNHNLRNVSLAHCVDALDAKAIVVGNNLKEAFLEIDRADRFPNEMVWYVEEAANTPEASTAITTTSTARWNQAIAQASHKPPPALPCNKSREHLIYVYTSGTSGLPKAAIITTPRYIFMVAGVRYSFGIYKSDILYTALPLYHTLAGIVGAGQMLIRGTPLVIRPKFSASQFWDDCIKYKCTVVQYIGETCRYLVAQPPKPSDTKHNVRLAFGNGLRRETWLEFQKRFQVPQIGELYGATESNSGIINCDRKLGAIGFIPQTIRCLYPIYLIKMDPITEEPVRDAETGLCIECDTNEPGQMIGRINNRNPARFYDGYVNREASQKKVLRNVFRPGDAWFASGDLLYCDELGYLYFSDRLGDTFRWRGENVSTAEVESVLHRAFPEQAISVYGVQVPGNEGKAGMAAMVVNLTNLSPEKEQELVAKLYAEATEHLPIYARPLFLRLCETIEMTSTFKLRKVDLVKAGFNPAGSNDHLFWLDQKSKSYRRLDEETYENIKQGKLRL